MEPTTKDTFPRVEAVKEAKCHVEYDSGQTQALKHHNAEFDELLEKLLGNDLLDQPTDIGATSGHCLRFCLLSLLRRTRCS